MFGELTKEENELVHEKFPSRYEGLLAEQEVLNEKLNEIDDKVLLLLHEVRRSCKHEYIDAPNFPGTFMCKHCYRGSTTRL